MENQVVKHSAIISASPEKIFLLLSDPRRHHEIDGSGTVTAAKIQAPERLKLGSKFGMKMTFLGLPYVISSTVVEFEQDQRIAWAHLGKHRWRYELEPTDTGTKVTESFDYSTSFAPWAIKMVGYPEKNSQGIKQTLVRMEEVLGNKVG